MFDSPHINLILLILNIIALGNFAYPPKNQFLIILVLLMILPLNYSIKVKMRTITLLSIAAAFMRYQLVCELLCIVALGLAVNTAYELDLTQGPAMINSALALSQILSFWVGQYLQKNSTNRDITLLIFTLPNLFLCYECQAIKGKTLYLINPFLDSNWLYSFGFFISIYTTNLTSIQKHYKFFSIAVLLLIETIITQVPVLNDIFAFLRGLLIYTEHVHPSEKYFLLAYLAVKVFMKEQLRYVMFLGYMVIGVVLFQEAKVRRERRIGRKDQGVETEGILVGQGIEMMEIKNR